MCVDFERKKSRAELRGLLRSEPVSLMINKDRLRWFGHVECKHSEHVGKKSQWSNQLTQLQLGVCGGV